MLSPGERLDSWKEIADYLKRDVRTVQRWEATESLPVHRLLHLKRPTVYAFPEELDVWLQEHEPGESNHENLRRGWSWPWLLRAFAAAMVVIGILATTSLMKLGSSDSNSKEDQPYSLSAVTSYPGHEDHATFSPGGDQVVFAWDGGGGGASDLWVKQVKQGTRLRLTETPQREYSPTWAQDGSVIAFLQDLEDGMSSIQLVSPLGGSTQKVAEIRTPSRLWGRQLEWAPGGGWLFTSDREPGGSSSIVAISAATGERRVISTPPVGYFGDHSPAFSRNGSLVFVRSVAEAVSDLYLFPDTRDLTKLGKPRRLTFLQEVCMTPVWLDRNTVLFSAGVWPNLELITVDTSGKVSKALPFSTKGAVSPAYSASTKRLIFTQTDVEINIWRLPLVAHSESDPTPEPFLASSRLDWLPRFSQKGDRIIFSSQRSGWEELWLSKNDGEVVGPVTRFQGTHCGEVSWSPDDKRVAFHSCIDGACDVFVKDAKVCLSEGPTCEIVPCCLRKITSSEYDDFSPFWSADGKWLYFASFRTGRIELWKTGLEGEEPIQVTRAGGVFGAEDAPRGILYFTKWDQPGIWSMSLDGGEERQVVENAYHRFAIVAGKIYYVGFPLERNDHFRIRSLDLASGEEQEIAHVERRFGWSLDAAPDGSALLWAQFDRDSRDLILVENF